MMTVSLETNGVQTIGVREDDVPRDLRGYPSEIFLDNLQRMGKRRVRMGKIRGPHIVALAEELPGRRTQRIVLERSPHVASHILTRLEWQLPSIGDFSMDMVEAMHPVGHPSDVVLRRHDLQGGKPLEHAAVHHAREALLDDVN